MSFSTASIVPVFSVIRSEIVGVGCVWGRVSLMFPFSVVRPIITTYQTHPTHHVIEGGIKDTSSTISDLMTEKTGTVLAVLKDIKEDNEILHHMVDNQQIHHNAVSYTHLTLATICSV